MACTNKSSRSPTAGPVAAHFQLAGLAPRLGFVEELRTQSVVDLSALACRCDELKSESSEHLAEMSWVTGESEDFNNFNFLNIFFILGYEGATRRWINMSAITIALPSCAYPGSIADAPLGAFVEEWDLRIARFVVFR